MASLDREWLKATEPQVILEALGVAPEMVAEIVRQIRIDRTVTPTADTAQLTQLVEELNKVSDEFARLLEVGQAKRRQETRGLPLSKAIEKWLEAVESAGRRGATLVSYRRPLSCFLDQVGERELASIEPEDVRSFFTRLRGRGSLSTGKPLSEAYIARIHRTICVFFNFCLGEGWISDTPLRRVKAPEVSNSEPKAIEWKDFQRLMATTHRGALVDRRDAAIMLVMHDGGLRVGEVCELRISDLDLEGKLIKRANEVKVRKERPRPITLATRRALQSWLEMRPSAETDALFISLKPQSYGKPITPCGISQMLQRRAKAGRVVGHSNPHSFRHARGRDHIVCGGDTSTGAKLLGHSNERTFSNFYARFGIGDLQKKHSQHNSISTRLGYAELEAAEKEDPLLPPEFVVEIETAHAPSRREVQRHFRQILDGRQQVSLAELLSSSDCDPGMLASLLDCCGLSEGFDFQVVFPPADLAVGPLPAVENHLLRVSDVMIERRAACS